jgi:Late embryogenesis abundant protein
MGKAAIAATIVLVSIVLVIGLFYYSYTQIHVTLNDVKFHSIEWTSFSWSTLLSLGLNVLTGNWLGAAFDLIDGINLNLIFGVSNNGFIPVYIPDLSYDLFVNGVSVGHGYTNLATSIYPGETREITSLQNFKKSSLNPAIYSIVSNGGVMEIKVRGTAYFQFLGFSIPIPFESTKQISIVDEIKSRLNNEIQNQQEIEKRAAAAKLEESIAKAAQSIQEELFGTPSVNHQLSGDTIVNSIYKISPGDNRSVYFTLPCEATIQGEFVASAALGDNIIVYVFNESEYNNFIQGRSSNVYYQSGKVESDSFELTLDPGTYYVTMSNTYSTFSTKTVALQVAGMCQ